MGEGRGRRSMTTKYVNDLQCDNIIFSLRFVGIGVPPRIFWRGPLEAPVSWFGLGWTCCQVFGVVQTDFCIASLCPPSVVEHRHEHDPFIKEFWSLAIQVFLNMHLGVNTKSTWQYVPNALHFSGCQVSCFDKSVFVPYIVHFHCPTVGWILIWENPTHNVESENTRTLILIILRDRWTSWCIFSISVWLNINFLFTWMIFCRNLSPGAWCSSLFQLPRAWCDTSLHVWSRLQPCIPVEVLRDSPCWHSFR